MALKMERVLMIAAGAAEADPQVARRPRRTASPPAMAPEPHQLRSIFAASCLGVRLAGASAARSPPAGAAAAVHRHVARNTRRAEHRRRLGHFLR